MKLSRKVRYAISCLFELDSHFGEDLRAETIAVSRKVPVPYAQKILHALASHGLIVSKKGSGYRATKRLESITALEVVEIVGERPKHPGTGPSDILQERLDRVLRETTLDSLKD